MYVFRALFDATIKITAKGYVNDRLIKVSALIAEQLFSSNESISPRPPEPRRRSRSRPSLRPRRRQRGSRCALKEYEKIDRYSQKLSRVGRHFDVKSRSQAASTSTVIRYIGKALRGAFFSEVGRESFPLHPLIGQVGHRGPTPPAIQSSYS